MSTEPAAPLPTVSLGRGVSVSRLIVGHNPPCGNSHVTVAVDDDMRSYFTAENVVGLYRRCEQLGMRTLMIRGDFTMLHWLELYRRAGGTMNVLAQTASEMHDIFANIRILASAGAAGIYHHGTQTDKFWRLGQIDRVRDYLQCMRDSGVAVGLGTHRPDVVDYALQHHWDFDFLMASFYNISRVARESSLVTGVKRYEDERYLPEDPPAMLRLIRSMDKPVLAFKILAAGRLCDTQDQVRDAFRFAYANIKPTDAVVIGLFPKYLDQAALDIQYAREAMSGTRT